jgi:hypothetical protein
MTARTSGIGEGRSAVESDSAPDGQGDEQGISPLLPEVLAGLDSEETGALIQVIALYREFPAWAVWLPHGGRQWTAVRPASARAPGPELPMIWVQAGTAEELVARMRGADAQLTPA